MCVEGNKGVDNLAKNATEKQRIEFALQHGPPECTEIIDETVKDRQDSKNRWKNTWRNEGKGMCATQTVVRNVPLAVKEKILSLELTTVTLTKY